MELLVMPHSLDFDIKNISPFRVVGLGERDSLQTIGDLVSEHVNSEKTDHYIPTVGLNKTDDTDNYVINEAN
jgi:hypothetical protein